jgi:hypothetical protein
MLCHFVQSNLQKELRTTAATEYLITHEVGHVVDFNSSQIGTGASGKQPSGSTAFDNAMQNDWYNLDYYAASGNDLQPRPPCYTNVSALSPAALQPAIQPANGPLVGLADPNNSNAQFCSNGALTAASAETYGTDLNSVIINETADYPSVFSRQQSYQDSTKAVGNPGVVPKVGWREWFAQAFAIQANNPYTNSNHQTVNPDVAGKSDQPSLDSIVNGGYFSCTGNQINGWLHYVYIQDVLATCSAVKPPADFPARHTPVHN